MLMEKFIHSNPSINHSQALNLMEIEKKEEKKKK